MFEPHETREAQRKDNESFDIVVVCASVNV